MITSGKITEVKAKRMKDGNHQQLAINVNIEDMKVQDGVGTVAYTYTITYDPGVAQISVAGELYFDDKGTQDIKKAEEGWKKSRTVPTGIAEDVLSAITYSGSSVGTLAAFAINIAAPINVPRARLAPSQQSGKAG